MADSPPELQYADLSTPQPILPERERALNCLGCFVVIAVLILFPTLTLWISWEHGKSLRRREQQQQQQQQYLKSLRTPHPVTLPTYRPQP